MNIIKTSKEIQELVGAKKKQGISIGFVPTMGYLHEGHKSLIANASKENNLVITSIFVNPLQFGPNEDFERYPRDVEHDIQVAKENGVDVLFMPDVAEMYPSEQAILLRATKRTNVLCGKSREGHFDGVVTVLSKFFNIILPDRVYFGMKDAQQLAVVDSLITDLNYPIELRAVATIREHDGLAKSSRNVYLSETERAHAKNIYRALQVGQNLVLDGEKNSDKIVKEVKDFIIEHSHGKIDYVELLNYPELTPIPQITNQVILATAVHYKHARLIDNIIFDEMGITLDRIK